MRSYAKLAPTFWTGSTGREIRRKGPEAVIVALYLLSAPGSTMLGLYYQPVLHMAHETGLGVEGAHKGLDDCITAGFCHYDESTEIVWVVEMAAFQIAKELRASDNRCGGIQRDYDSLPDNPFLGAFFDRYQRAFHLSGRRGSKGASKALPSQEQEQEQAQERASSLRSDSSTTSAPTDLLGNASKTEKRASTAENLAAVTETAITAYNSILGRPNGLLPSVNANVGKPKRRDQVRRMLAVASDICLDQFGNKTVTAKFCEAYFQACAEDPFHNGRGPYVGPHANWRPDFEFLTRPATVLKVFERATQQDVS